LVDAGFKSNIILMSWDQYKQVIKSKNYKMKREIKGNVLIAYNIHKSRK